MVSLIASLFYFLIIISPMMGERSSYRPKSKTIEGSVPIVPGLSYTYYDDTCPFVQSIIGEYLYEVFQSDITQAAGLLRLHYHDCFVQGCDGSVLLDGSNSRPSEKDALPNLTLRKEAFKIVNELQSRIQHYCGPVVSCSDILALAARDSVYLTGGPHYNIPLGRKDSVDFATENTTLDNMPPSFLNTTTLLTAFAKKNFTMTDVVALSGGHTIGRSHCASFTDRLYPKQDPTMDQPFANNLKLTCPAWNTTNTTMLDIRSPNIFDNKYYVDLVNRQGLFTSDQDLYIDLKTRGIVTSFATDQRLFFDKFVIAMLKMGQLSVLTGNHGEIRLNCSARNPHSMGQWSVVDDSKPQGRLCQY